VKAALVLALAAAALAGCGSSGDGRLSRSGYESKLHAAFTTAFDRVKTQEVTPQLVAASYRGLATSLKSVRPPVNVQSLNDELVDGASKQATALSALVASVRGKPRAVRDRILAQFDPSGIAGRQEFDRAVAALEAKGYRFRPSGGR
jgi:hypothetical protein